MNKDFIGGMKELAEETRALNLEKDEDINEIANLGRALSSPIRLEILRALNVHPMTAGDIGKKFSLPFSSVMHHMQMLEDANLVHTEVMTKNKKQIKWYSYCCARNLLLLRKQTEMISDKHDFFTVSVAVGDFIDAKFGKDCGMASETEHLMSNQPWNVFSPQRHSAQIIWTNSGYVTYAIQNSYATGQLPRSVNLSLEICSEANGYNHNYPSDITFYINDVELCTWTCPGDFGDRYGKYTPDWWFAESTKYGLLTNVTVRRSGVYVNETLMNPNVTIKDLSLEKGNRTTFTIGVKENAVHKGGLNIFGEKFGDYPQDIVFTAIYDK